MHVKKTYCPSCRRLVRGIQENTNGKININCSICGRLLWVWDGFFWKPAKKTLNNNL